MSILVSNVLTTHFQKENEMDDNEKAALPTEPAPEPASAAEPENYDAFEIDDEEERS